MISFKNSGIKSDSNIFKRKIIKKPAGIVTPLKMSDEENRVLSVTYSAEHQLKDNFRNLILTNKGDRLGRYDYGCDLRKLVSEINSHDDFEQKVMENISLSTKKYMPMIELESFNSEYNNDSEDELKNIKITVIYNIPLMGLNNQKIDVTLYLV